MNGSRTQDADVSPEVEQVIVAGWRCMSPADKARGRSGNVYLLVGLQRQGHRPPEAGLVPQGQRGLGSTAARRVGTTALRGPTLPGTYPGKEVLRWNAGAYQYEDPCTGISRQETFFGATTIGGWTALQLGGTLTLPLTFVDQGNSVKGNPSFTTLNEPFRSDHILNLNY